MRLFILWKAYSILHVHNILNLQDLLKNPKLVVRGSKQIKQFVNLDLSAMAYEAVVPNHFLKHVDSSLSFD